MQRPVLLKLTCLAITSLLIPPASLIRAQAATAGTPAPQKQAEQARQAQQAATDADYDNMLHQLGLTRAQIRPGADGYNKSAPNYVNYDESKVPPYTLPDPLHLPNGHPVLTAKQWWTVRRPQLVHLLEDDMYGRVPTHTPDVKWEVTSTTPETINGTEVITRKLVGHVDNAADPAITVNIQADLTLPAHPTGRVPVMIAFDWPPEFYAEMARRMGRTPTPPAGPSAREIAIGHGWGYAMLIPTSVQADTGAGLTAGIIGLSNHGAHRTPDQWGALRAWGWAAGKLLDYFGTIPEIDTAHVGISGHSRYGKAALVTMAFDQRFWIGYISSSGEAGAKLSRRQYGELVENIAASGEYHWMAGNFLRYAGPLHVSDLPVDAHDLIALCAPRPLFISAGTTAAGDGWVDAKGQFLAAAAASPVYKLLGAQGLNTTTFPLEGTEIGAGPLVFRQHAEGHTPMPNWPFFYEFANRELNAPAGEKSKPS